MIETSCKSSINTVVKEYNCRIRKLYILILLPMTKGLYTINSSQKTVKQIEVIRFVPNAPFLYPRREYKPKWMVLQKNEFETLSYSL